MRDDDDVASFLLRVAWMVLLRCVWYILYHIKVIYNLVPLSLTDVASSSPHVWLNCWCCVKLHS